MLPYYTEHEIQRMDNTQFINAFLYSNKSYESMKILKNFKRPYNLRGKPRNFDYDGTMQTHLINTLKTNVLTCEWDILEHSSCVYERALYKKWKKNPAFKPAFKRDFIDIIFNYLFNHNVINNEYKNDSRFTNSVIKKLDEFRTKDKANKARWDLYQKLLILLLF